MPSTPIAKVLPTELPGGGGNDRLHPARGKPYDSVIHGVCDLVNGVSRRPPRVIAPGGQYFVYFTKAYVKRYLPLSLLFLALGFRTHSGVYVLWFYGRGKEARRNKLR